MITLKGKIRSSLDSITRVIEVSRPESSETIDSLFIPCRYWTLTSNCLLTAIKEGTIVFVRGRIENDEKIGLYVLVETIESLN